MAVYYFPYKSSLNKYLENMQNIINKKMEVEELPGPKAFFKLFFLKKRDLLILNWVEDSVSKRDVGSIVFFCIHLLITRVLFNKVIWVRHNFQAHDHDNHKRYTFMCFFLNKICNLKVTHRPILGYEYLPHPTYVNKQLITVAPKRKIDYLYFGIIKRYKGLTDLLSEWPADKELFIRGLCSDNVLEQEILSIIKNRNLLVDYKNEFITNSKLDSLLLRTKVVVLPHLNNKMIVSGAFYHAASFGVNVMLRDGGFYKYLKEKFTFVHPLGSFDGTVVNSFQVVRELESECGEQSILSHFEYLNTLKSKT